MLINESYELNKDDLYFSLGMIISDYILEHDNIPLYIKDNEPKLMELYRDKDIHMMDKEDTFDSIYVYVLNLENLKSYYRWKYNKILGDEIIPVWLKELTVIVSPNDLDKGHSYTNDMSKIINTNNVEGVICICFKQDNEMMVGLIMHELTHLYMKYITYCVRKISKSVTNNRNKLYNKSKITMGKFPLTLFSKNEKLTKTVDEILHDQDCLKSLLAYTVYYTDYEEVYSFIAGFLGYMVSCDAHHKITIFDETTPSKYSYYRIYLMLRNLWVEIYNKIANASIEGDSLLGLSTFIMGYTQDIVIYDMYNYYTNYDEPNNTPLDQPIILRLINNIIVRLDAYMDACQLIVSSFDSLKAFKGNSNSIPNNDEIVKKLQEMHINVNDIYLITSNVNLNNIKKVSKILDTLKTIIKSFNIRKRWQLRDN